MATFGAEAAPAEDELLERLQRDGLPEAVDQSNNASLDSGQETAEPSARLRPRRADGLGAFVPPAKPARGPSPRAASPAGTTISSQTEDDCCTKQETTESPSHCARPERLLSEPQKNAQKDELRRNWDFYAVLDFVEVLSDELDLKEVPSVDRLEEALITHAGAGPSLLADIHEVLIRGINPSCKVNAENWQMYMAKRMRLYFELDPQDNPFKAADTEEEAGVYAALTAQERCVMLRALCDLRADKEDMRALIELSHLSERAQLKALSTESVQATLEDIYEPEDFQKEPWGEDASDRMYWLLDMGGDRGLRLCREGAPVEVESPAPAGKAKGKAKRAVPDQDLEGGQWETLACDLDEIEQVGRKLMKSRRKDDVTLGTALVDELVAEARERRDEELRQQAAADQRAAQREALLEAGRSRSMRQRKPVDYRFPSDIDDVLKEVLKASMPPRSARRRAALGFVSPPDRVTQDQGSGAEAHGAGGAPAPPCSAGQGLGSGLVGALGAATHPGDLKGPVQDEHTADTAALADETQNLPSNCAANVGAPAAPHTSPGKSVWVGASMQSPQGFA